LSVDLGEYVNDYRLIINPPGEDLYPNMGDSEAIDRLRNGFWTAKLDTFLASYTESEGLISNTSTGGPEITRDLIQLVIYYTALDTIATSLRNTTTVFRAKAGPVEYETQNSAQLLRDLFQELRQRKNFLLQYLAGLGVISPGYVDMVIARGDSIYFGGTPFFSGVE
jgi:hypothetical protein